MKSENKKMGTDKEMKDRLPELIYSSIMKFINESYYEMLSYNVDSDRLRIAFPDYLVHYFIQGSSISYQNMNSMDTIMGIKVQETYENCVTLYCIDSPLFPDRYPVFKFSFLTSFQEYGWGNKVMIDFAKHFNFKL